MATFEVAPRPLPQIQPLPQTLSFRVKTGEDVELARRFVQAHLQRPKVRRIRLRPLSAPEPLGPPCLTCERHLDRRETLVACPRCLNVSHAACWPEGLRCRCERPRERGGNPPR